MPPMLEFMFLQSGLERHSTFVDLGSGIGNAVVQAAFMIGCFSYGIEIREELADLAQIFVKEFKIRSAFVGVSPGRIELEKGDMYASARVVEVLKQADLVLLNNKLFDEMLTEDLKTLLLNMKSGGVLVCTKSLTLCGTTRRGTRSKRGSDEFTDKFESKTLMYNSEWVSWSDKLGDYYWLTKVG
ncbi:histone methylation DOT1 [Lentinula raphanica]|nr:histone methylation DOT1 [Lentinula raphanica]